MGLLRLLLAFAVLAGHTGVLDFEILPGPVAVRAFFLLSGFTMALVLETRYAGLPRRSFYLSRLLRLAPAYAVVLALSLAAMLALDSHPFLRRDTLLGLVLADVRTLAAWLWTNLAVFGQEAMYWLRVAPGGALAWSPGPVAASAKAYTLLLVPQAWSLSLEFCFYLAAPWIFSRGPRLVGGLLLASLALHVGLDRAFPQLDPVWQRILPTQLYLFLAGYFSHAIYARLRDTPRARFLGHGLLLLLALFGALYEILSGPMRFAVFQCLLCLALPVVFLAFRNNPLDRFLGRLSYPFYLVHFLVIGVFEDRLGEAGPLALVGLVLAGALALHLGVEVPFERVRRRLVARGAAHGRSASPDGPGLAPQPSA
ncbi:MAG: acyltransferase [Thermodesulfobacteriota bacterium]